MNFVSIGSFGRDLWVRACLLLLFIPVVGVQAQTATNIQVTSTVLASSVKRLGVNLADQTFYDSGQMLKNLIFQNPGFEPQKYRSIMICAAVSSNSCVDDNIWSPQPSAFWAGATYTFLTGSAAGKAGTVASSTVASGSSGQTIVFDQNVNPAVGDYFVMTQNFPGHGDQGWWDSTSGGGTITSETSDLSPETPGTQAVALNASGPGQSATLTSYFDSEDGLSFIQLNGAFAITFRAKGIGGNNQLAINMQRTSTSGNLVYLNKTVTLTNAWQDYTVTFNANETGSANGTAQLVFTASGGSLELDDVALEQTNSDASNTTAFRDDVVNALNQLHPGTIRMMAGDAALGSDLINQIQVPYARYREGWSTGGTETDVVAYGIHEFLQLCQTVGADPWITIPTATTPAEMQAFIQYLTGTGADQYSALRISRGQAAPWTSVFNKIHLELGNETWNGSFRGESMTYDGYPYQANTVFGAARSTPGYVANKFDLVLDGFLSAGYDQVLLARSTMHDSIDMAPYLLFSANNEPMSTMFGALFAEPEMWTNSGGSLNTVMTTAQAAPTPTYLNVYETNLSPIEGAITEAQLNQLTPSIGAGLGHTVHMLEMMRMGVRYQNAFALPQYAFERSDGLTVKLWGIVRDMGTTNRRRPQFLTQAMANSAIAGNMVATTQTGANPTWNQPLSSDSVQLNGAHYLQSFAFQNGSTVSTVIFNLNQTTALPVTFSGANAPSGSVEMTQITSANITDNNENSTVVQPTTQTLGAFNPATGLTLPPFSMTVLTSSASGVQPPVFSVAPGTYTTPQSVAISDATSGTSIYYTTDGSTPTTGSALYTGPIAVSTSQTINAIAALSSGFSAQSASAASTSTVSSAAYVISAPTAATPTFSLAAGSYSSAQTVTIADATSGAAIYYTTNGTTPTSSSLRYTGAITVSASETLKAIAVAANYTNSTVATAAYTIETTAATPTFSVAAGSYSSAQTVTIADATSGAAIYYTTNGTTPTSSSLRYTVAVTVNASETLKAIAIAANYTDSTVATAAYTIETTAATPTFSVAAGSYSSAQTVTIADATSGAAIYYTTNGTTPTSSSLRYTGAITVSASETLKAIAVAANYTNSAVAAAAYTIETKVATPTFSVAAGSYSSAQTVTIADATSGAAIYYTTNGTTPTSSSLRYTGAITVSASETLKAIAVAANYTNSAVATAAYTITAVAAPVFSLPSGTYSGTRTLTLTDATEGAAIYYQINGTGIPTLYTGPISVSQSERVSAIALGTDNVLSNIVTMKYIIQGALPSPTFSVAAGTYSSAQTITIEDARRSAAIYYTTDGTTPTTSSNRYTGPITVSASETLEAIAVENNYRDSAVATAAYTITSVAPPVFSLPSGTYRGSKMLTLTDATAGSLIYYQINFAGTPTLYTGPFEVSQSETVSAIALSTNNVLSAIVTMKYTIRPQ